VRVDANTPSVADGVNPATRELTKSNTDLPTATYGPALDLTRTYSSLLAQQETATALPGLFGYGWANSLGANLTFNAPQPGWLYLHHLGSYDPVEGLEIQLPDCHLQERRIQF
jgi:hypothetical protein